MVTDTLLLFDLGLKHAKKEYNMFHGLPNIIETKKNTKQIHLTWAIVCGEGGEAKMQSGHTFRLFFYPSLRIWHLEGILNCTLHCNTLHYTTIQYTTSPGIRLNYTVLHCNILKYASLHCSTLHYTTLHCDTLCHISLYCTTLHYTALHFINLQ